LKKRYKKHKVVPALSITKIYSRKVSRELNYATQEHLIEELSIFERQTGWAIFEMLEVLKRKKADCFSLTKEKPFTYLYARVRDNEIFIRLQTAEEETEFSLPIEKIKSKRS